jgi:hypothetical protein
MAPRLRSVRVKPAAIATGASSKAPTFVHFARGLAPSGGGPGSCHLLDERESDVEADRASLRVVVIDLVGE